MTIAPGWYADPDNAAQLRWWDGAQWTPQAMPVPGAGPAVGSGYPPQTAYAPRTAPSYPGGLRVASPKSFLARNVNSALAVAVAIVYGVLAIFAHLVFLGIFPIILTVNAFRAKEPYATIALVVSVAAVVFGIFMLTR